MKNIQLTLLFCICSSMLTSQTTLAPGDIAFTLLNMDGSNTDAVAFVLLTDVSPNTKIVITDDEYINGSLTTGEGRLEITFTSAFSCGTVIFIQDTNSDPATYVFQATTGPGSTAGLSTNNAGSGNLSLSSAGETMIAFQDNNPNTTAPAAFISALANTGVSFGATATGSGDLPPGLSIGINALALPANGAGAEFDNYTYNCSFTNGTPTQLSAGIYTASRWNGNDATPYSVTSCGFTCQTACTDPVINSISVNPSSSCPGTLVTLSITGSLGDAAEWRLHEGTCTNSIIDNTTGSTFTVDPSKTTTYTISALDCNNTAVCFTTTVNRTVPAADAGPDQLLASGTSVNLAAYSTGAAVGSWVILSGDGNGVLGNSASPNSSFSGTPGQAYILQWTVSGGGCPNSIDLVEVSFTQGTTDLTTGDLAFIGFNSDAPDEFSFILLEDIEAGTMISFTDMGWLQTGGFRTTAEGYIMVTFDRHYSCGDAFYMTRPVSPTNDWVAFDENGLSAGIVTLPNPTATRIEIGTSGDQLFAFQGSLSNPTLLAGIHIGELWNNAVNNSSSAQPPALTGNNTSVNLPQDIDNAIYDCSVTSGLPATLSAAINDPTNWSLSNNLISLTPTCNFDCQNCFEPMITEVTVDLDTVCQGTPITLTINGTLNGANQWAVYETSCGVNLLATSTTNILTFNPDITKTYYVAGIDGCVATPDCTLVQINVTGNEADVPQSQIITNEGVTWTTIQPFPPTNGQTATLEFLTGDGQGSVSGPTGSNVWTINGTAGQSYTLRYSHSGGSCPTTSDEFAVAFIQASTLALGDIAFTGINTSIPDGFSFVALQDITAGTVINFTERGWDDGFHTTEGSMALFLTSSLSCGESVYIQAGATTEIVDWSARLSGSSQSAGMISQIGNTTAFAPNSNGDQIFAYQGNDPTAEDQSGFLAGIHTACNGCGVDSWDAVITGGDSNDSAKPSIFETGDANYTVNFPSSPNNAKFDCANAVSGDPSLQRDALSNASNWSESATPFDLSSACPSACIEPPTAVCQNITVQIDASGNPVFIPADLDGGSTGDNMPFTFSVDRTPSCADIFSPIDIVLTVTNSTNAAATCTSKVTVEDNIAPEVTCQNVVFDLNADSSFVLFRNILINDILTSFIDNCAPSSVSEGLTQVSFDCEDIGINTVIVYYRDRQLGQSSQEDNCLVQIQINDPLDLCGSSPIVNCKPFTAGFNAPGNYVLDANSLDNGSTDDRSVYSLVFDPASDRQEHLIQDCAFTFEGQGQSFTAGQNGVVQTIRVRSMTSVSTTIHLYAGDNGSGVPGSIGSPLYSQAVELFASPDGAFTEILLTTPFPVSLGSEYTFILEGTTSIYYDCGSPLGYVGGRTMLNFVQWAGGTNQDYTFQVDIIGASTMDFNEEGSYNLDVYAVDDQGNVSSACNTTFILETICSDNRQEDDNPITAGLYEVSSTIRSAGVVSAGKVDFSAKAFIELQAGFEVINGNEFNAFIEGCDSPSTIKAVHSND